MTTMKSLQVANGLLRSSPSTCNALSRTAPLLNSRIASSPIYATAAHVSSPVYSIRSFSQTPPQHKKRNNREKETPEQDELVKERGGSSKNNKSTKATAAAPATPSTPADPNNPVPDPSQPYDLSDLTHTFDKADAYHTSELQKLRSGGRFNADVIGAIPVTPDRKNAPTTSFPLRELATVAPLGGRKWSILAFEEASIKPIMSAMQASDEFNQQPQRSEDNPLELTISVEPERADALSKRVKDTCLAWRGKIRDVSHKRTALHKKWRAGGAIVEDDVRKLKEKVQKMQDDRMKVVDGREKEVLAAIAKR